MYIGYFGLNDPPFKITPNTEFFYTGGNRGAILEALLYAIIHGEGIVKVTGEIGSGKTMLCRMLESILPGNVEAIYLANPSLSRDEVFHAIAGELGLATENKRGGEIMRLMQNCLIEKHAAGKQMVLLVEEAQAMPLDTLEEVRLLSNLETSHHKLLQIILFGQPELDDHLNLPQMRQLKERITHGFNVPPLGPKDIPEYLMFRMRAAGYHGPDIFSTGAIKLITTSSKGITRRINVLADKALLAAFSDNTHNIRPKHVKAAIEDSHFAVPSRALPVQQIALAVSLLGLGIAIGAGWPHVESLALQSGEFASAEHTAPLLFLGPPTVRETSAPTQVPEQAEYVPAPTVDAENAAHKNSLVEQQLISVDVPIGSHNQLQQRLDATKAWLADEDGSHFTVQLMLLTENGTKPRSERVLNALDKQFGLEQIFVYPTRITADNQLGITFGSFSSRQQALAALAKLPTDYMIHRPMLRTVKGIRDEIEKQRTQNHRPQASHIETTS
ncbi:ExeA family protein [Propionivibrio sp.]|uniref:ExeA family protein n=1 Tax=Propionivibrio sp. TaxID=2212460 RepID=UPI003BEF804E